MGSYPKLRLQLFVVPCHLNFYIVLPDPLVIPRPSQYAKTQRIQ